MSLLKWNANYSVGIASMDDEHRQMIDLINEIYGRMASGSDTDQIEKCLGDIFNTISMHFALEESLMKKSHYAEYPQHKDDHEELLEQIRTLMDDFAAAPALAAKRLETDLSDWFAGHFSTFDARLHGKLGEGDQTH